MSTTKRKRRFIVSREFVKQQISKAQQAGVFLWTKADLRKPDSWLGTLVSLLLRIGTLLIIIALGVLVYRIFNDEGYSIQEVSMPENFVKQGYSGIITARMLQDEYVKVKEIAASVKADSVRTIGGDDQPELTVAVMGMGISLRTVAYHLRELLGRRSNLLRTEITQADTSLALTLRMTGFPLTTFQASTRAGERQALQTLLRKAGETVLGNTDPYRLAIYLERNNRLEESLQQAAKILDHHLAERHWGLVAYGNALESLGYNEEAAEKYQEATQIKPDFALVWTRLGWILGKLNQQSEAVNCYKKAIEFSPNDADFWDSYAYALARAHQTAESDVAFAKAVQLQPNNIAYLINWAEAKKQVGDLEGAKNVMLNGVKERSSEVARAISKAYIAYLGNDITKMDLTASLALQLDPKNKTIAQFAINVFQQSRNYTKVIETCALLVDTEDLNKRQDCLNLMAMSYNSLGQHDSAFQIIRRCIKLNPNRGDPYSTLAETYAFTGDHAQFYNWLEKAFQMGFLPSSINPTDEPYRRYQKDRRYNELVKRTQPIK